MVRFLKWVGIACLTIAILIPILIVAALFFLVLLSAPRKEEK